VFTKKIKNYRNISNNQDTLPAGTNKTIVDNVNPSSGGGDITQEDIDLKQVILNQSSNVYTGSIINYGSITGRDLAVLDFQTTNATIIR
jgi:hypothetical protein